MNNKEKTLYIFCGNKGGTGKTLFSLVSILKSFFDGKRIVAIDLNFENPDLATILHSIMEGKQEINNASVINKGTPLAYQEEKINDRLYSVRPYPLYH
ncbi:MAG: hypothetical protein ACTSRA_16515, partial [Promethearchaeota archaeon]